jgi:hypothetical protein
MQRSAFLASSAAAAAALALPRVPAAAAHDMTPAAAAVRAYTFAYPLVMVELTERAQIAQTGYNRFRHDRHLAGPDNKFIVRPNVDTLYSSAFVNLANGPVVLSIPNSHHHFFVCQVMDAWTNVFADPGTRTTGEDAHQIVFVGPGQTATVPSGMTRVDAPTNACWFFVRIALHAGADVAGVHAMQDGFTLAPIATGVAPAGVDHVEADTVDRAKAVAALDADAFFTIAMQRLVGNPPPRGDEARLADLAVLGLEPGMTVNGAKLTRERRSALHDAPAAALAVIQGASVPASGITSTGWLRPDPTIGRFGGDDLLRARTAFYGLAANLPEDAVYFATRASGAHPLQMLFAAGDIPPEDGFWSLTIYDTSGFLIANPTQKYALRSGDPFVHQPDGTLILTLGQHPPADPDRAAANWLPTPDGPYTLLLRLYAPRSAAIDGRWIPPALLADG